MTLDYMETKFEIVETAKANLAVEWLNSMFKYNEFSTSKNYRNSATLFTSSDDNVKTLYVENGLLGIYIHSPKAKFHGTKVICIENSNDLHSFILIPVDTVIGWITEMKMKGVNRMDGTITLDDLWYEIDKYLTHARAFKENGITHELITDLINQLVNCRDIICEIECDLEDVD